MTRKVEEPKPLVSNDNHASRRKGTPIKYEATEEDEEPDEDAEEEEEEEEEENEKIRLDRVPIIAHSNGIRRNFFVFNDSEIEIVHVGNGRWVPKFDFSDEAVDLTPFKTSS